MKKECCYSPVVAYKTGEMTALGEIARQPQIADAIAPRIIIPDELYKAKAGAGLFSSEQLPGFPGVNIGDSWMDRPFFLDPQIFLKNLSPSASRDRLPSLVTQIRENRAQPILVGTIAEIKAHLEAYKVATESSNSERFGVRVPAGELVGDVSSELPSLMSQLSVPQSDVTIFIDFAGNDLTNTAVAAEVMQSAMEQVQEMGRWKQIIFQGSNYPDKNPATPDSLAVRSRKEWLAWSELNKTELKLPLIYGDYTADTSNIQFMSASGGRAYPHLRYCTDDSWLIARGSNRGMHAVTMKAVSKMLCEHPEFSNISTADGDIFEAATNGLSLGGAANWRKINIVRHITKVVHQIFALEGEKILEHHAPRPLPQLELI